MKKNDHTSSAPISSSVSTSSNCCVENEHNMWNPLLGLFCNMQIGLCMESLADEVSTTRIAPSCHLTLDSLCDKSNNCECLHK